MSEQLRECVVCGCQHLSDEIGRLEAENEALRERLESVMRVVNDMACPSCGEPWSTGYGGAIRTTCLDCGWVVGESLAGENEDE